MDILIKSFNRPYYLDRCLYSIEKYILNSTYSIVILDDGTPQKYLDKIKEKYPKVIILKSENYNDKINYIEGISQTLNANIPIELWISAARNATNYFLLLEDDIWFTSTLNLDDLQNKSIQDKVKMLKLFWLGNNKLIAENKLKSNSIYTLSNPKLYTKNPFLYNFIFKFYKYKIRKINTLFKIYTRERALSYYSIYSVAGAVFDKEYFLSLWNNHKNSIDEGLQIYNGLKYINKNENCNFGNTNSEVLKTGFVSSATNSHKDYKNVIANMFVFNKIINEAWFNNQMDVTNNLSLDLDMNQIGNILDKEDNPKCTRTEWEKWVAQFKAQYTKFGCKID